MNTSQKTPPLSTAQIILAVKRTGLIEDLRRQTNETFKSSDLATQIQTELSNQVRSLFISDPTQNENGKHKNLSQLLKSDAAVLAWLKNELERTNVLQSVQSQLENYASSRIHEVQNEIESTIERVVSGNDKTREKSKEQAKNIDKSSVAGRIKDEIVKVGGSMEKKKDGKETKKSIDEVENSVSGRKNKRRSSVDDDYPSAETSGENIGKESESIALDDEDEDEEMLMEPPTKRLRLSEFFDITSSCNFPTASSSRTSSDSSTPVPKYPVGAKIAAFIPPSKSKDPATCFIVTVHSSSYDTKSNHHVYTVRDLAALESSPVKGKNKRKVSEWTVKEHDLIDFEAIAKDWQNSKGAYAIGEKIWSLYRGTDGEEDATTEFYEAVIEKVEKKSKISVRFYDNDSSIVFPTELFRVSDIPPSSIYHEYPSRQPVPVITTTTAKKSANNSKSKPSARATKTTTKSKSESPEPSVLETSKSSTSELSDLQSDDSIDNEKPKQATKRVRSSSRRSRRNLPLEEDNDGNISSSSLGSIETLSSDDDFDIPVQSRSVTPPDSVNTEAI
ncbi:hypothetical protein BKA69DRAFT_477035 [Paraphysoderma sedebokerense]|nr:hypothetical protein BKA69DRAFT_477035 [Paraphysoderma sedebokerense]